MKNSILTSALLLVTFSVFSQETFKAQDKYTAHNKGKFFISWGGNRETFSKSDIHFKGTDYDFTLYDVTAHDKPKGWHIDYINPARMTIPQTNFRMGYFVNDHYSIAIGVDHMKYVMNQNQTVEMSGYINTPGYETGGSVNQPKTLTSDFLKFEHTDGLNYINTELTRFDDVSKWIGTDIDKFQLNVLAGAGIGLCALTADGQASAVTLTAVGLDGLKSLQVHAQFTTKIAFSHILTILDRIHDLGKLRL